MRDAASGSGAVVRDPGRLQLDRPPGGVVHLRYRQAEPVPQAPEPFAAGPGDRLFQLPLVDEIGRAGGGARRGCHIRRGQPAWGADDLVSDDSGAWWSPWWLGPGRIIPGGCAGGQVAGSTVGSSGGDHHAQPPTRQPTRWPTRIRAVSGPCVVAARHRRRTWRGWPGLRTVGPGLVPPGAGSRGGQVVWGAWDGDRAACAFFCRAAAAAAGRGEADPGGAGGGGRGVPAVGQQPGAGHQPDRAQGHRGAAGRCAGPDRAGGRTVRGGGPRHTSRPRRSWRPPGARGRGRER